MKKQSKTTKNSNLLVIVDEDYLYGLTHGYYPKDKETADQNSCLLISSRQAKNSYLIHHPKENNIYYKNPYSDQYLDLNSSKTEDLLILSKCVALKEMLLMLGAYSAKVEDEVSHKDSIEKNIDGGASHPAAGAEVSYSSSSSQAINIKVSIEFGANNSPIKPIDDIKSYAQEHGLLYDNDSYLIVNPWIERIEQNRRFPDYERITISYLTEYEYALNIAAKLKVLSFGASFSFSEDKHHSHSFTKNILVNWHKPVNGNQDNQK